MKKLIFIAVLISFAAVVYSDNPSQTPLVGAENKKDQAAHGNKTAYKEQHGTEQFPLVVKNISGPKSQEEREREAYQQHTKPRYEALTAYSTLALAVITAILAVCNIFLWISTTKAANAAKASANALPSIERAYVFVNTPNNKIKWIKDSTLDSIFITIPIDLHNVGKTPAILTKIEYDVIGMNAPPMKSDDHHFRIYEIPLGGRIIANRPYNFPIEDTISIKQWDDIQNEEGCRLYCYGLITYKDIFKRIHGVCFCWEYDPVDQCFIVTEKTDLNDYS